MYKTIVMVSALLFSCSSFASNALNVTVNRVNLQKTPAPKGSAWVGTSTSTSNTCGSNPAYVIDMNDPAADMLYAQVMTALNSEARVDLIGTGQCASFGRAELINEVRIFR